MFFIGICGAWRTVNIYTIPLHETSFIVDKGFLDD